MIFQAVFLSGLLLDPEWGPTVTSNVIEEAMYIPFFTEYPIGRDLD